MRELDRPDPLVRSCAVIGRGRLGSALALALPRGGVDVVEDVREAGAVLLCVPDRAIAAAATAIPPGPAVGHCSGATTLAPLRDTGHTRAFSVHPLMTVPAEGEPPFAGAAAAIAGELATARALAEAVGLRPIAVADEDRAAYHAAASIASNFLVTLEAAAERLAATAGVDREALAPLVRASVESWLALGPERALTGPIARGDWATVERQREAVQDRAPDLLSLFDVLVDATRAVAA